MAQAEHFLQAIHQAWQQAAQRCAPRQSSYCIGGVIVQLQMIGEALTKRLTPAFTHLATMTPMPPVPPVLIVYLCEGTASGIAMPTIPLQIAQTAKLEEIWGYFVHNENFQLFYQPETQALTLLDYTQNCAYYWIEDAQQLTLSDGGAPLITLLHWWFGHQGSQVVHGAAVGTCDGGVLLVGKSGSGKSTTALACLDAGLAYVGDDYCLVTTQPRPMVYSLYSSGKLHFADLVHFLRFQRALTSEAYIQADKALFFFAEQFCDQIVPALPLKAILLPAIITNTHTTWHVLSPAAALLAVAPSTVLQLVGNKSQSLQQLGRLVRQLPCYRLALGRELHAIPSAIAELLSTLRS